MKILAIIGAFLAVLAVMFLIDAGLVWLVVWGLNAIGIHSIFGWAVVFSWPLVVVVVVITMILRGIFSISVRNKE